MFEAVAKGRSVPSDLLGKLLDSHSLINDGAALRERLSRDGYVFLSGATVVDDPIKFVRDRGARLLTTKFAPGDWLIFGMDTFHSAFDNHSRINRARLTCDVRYQPASEPLDPRYFGPEPTGTTGAGHGELNGAKPLTEPQHARWTSKAARRFASMNQSEGANRHDRQYRRQAHRPDEKQTLHGRSVGYP